jgi:hypothetical protein
MPARQKKRVQLGIIVSRETKNTIAEMARVSGRSQGQISEDLIEKGLKFEPTLAGIRGELEEIRKRQPEDWWRREGYLPVHTAYGIVWCPRGYPGVQAFVEWRPGEPRPEPVEVPPPEPLKGETK